jgi:hypothetical protein
MKRRLLARTHSAASTGYFQPPAIYFGKFSVKAPIEGKAAIEGFDSDVLDLLFIFGLAPLRSMNCRCDLEQSCLNGNCSTARIRLDEP